MDDLNTYQITYKNKYIIKINRGKKKSQLIITISFNNNMNTIITHRESFSFEDIEKYDPTFFYPFNKNLKLLYKYLIRLLKAKLFNLDIKNINNGIISLVLNCLKNNKLKPIKIYLKNIDFPQDNGKKSNLSINIEKENKNNYIIDNNNGLEDDDKNKNKNEEYNKGSAPAPNINKNNNKYDYNIELNKIKNIFNFSMLKDFLIRKYNYHYF